MNEIIHKYKLVEVETTLLKNDSVKMVNPVDVHWCSYQDAYKTYLRNLLILQKITCFKLVKNKITDNVRKLVLHDNFNDEISRFLRLFDPVCTLVDNCQNMTTSAADAVNLYGWTWKYLQNFQNSSIKLQ